HNANEFVCPTGSAYHATQPLGVFVLAAWVWMMRAASCGSQRHVVNGPRSVQFEPMVALWACGRGLAVHRVRTNDAWQWPRHRCIGGGIRGYAVLGGSVRARCTVAAGRDWRNRQGLHVLSISLLGNR